jgi:hypothetical protein
MLMTITNTSGALLPIGFRGCVPEKTIAIGGNVVLGVSIADLYAGDDAGQGDPAWKYLDTLVKKGKATVAFAVDPNDVNVLDRANEV